MVSYKDHDKHVFNYNDSLVISHRLLDRWGIAVHGTPISISEAYKVYKKANGVTKDNDQDVRNAFNAYQNLLERNYVFQCDICKDAPEVLIFDGNAKLRCSMDFQRLVDKNVDGFSGVVNHKDFWKTNSLLPVFRMVSLKAKEVVNFKMAPIIDESVTGNEIWNTEFKKLNLVEDVSQSGHKELAVDQIRDICTKKLTSAQLRVKCEELGIPVPFY